MSEGLTSGVGPCKSRAGRRCRAQRTSLEGTASGMSMGFSVRGWRESRPHRPWVRTEIAAEDTMMVGTGPGSQFLVM